MYAIGFLGNVLVPKSLDSPATDPILVAIQLEERDLMRAHPEYAEYRRSVPMLVPSLRRQVTPAEPVHAAQA